MVPIRVFGDDTRGQNSAYGDLGPAVLERGLRLAPLLIQPACTPSTHDPAAVSDIAEMLKWEHVPADTTCLVFHDGQGGALELYQLKIGDALFLR